MQVLNNDEITNKIQELNSWSFENEQLVKKITLSNFIQAVGVFNMIAMEAEKIDHHPTIENTYNQLTILLSTHDPKGITSKDFDLAEKIDSIVESFK